MKSLYAGERLAKNILKETTTTIQNYNTALDALMQQFRDLAVRDTLINVHRMGKSWSQIHSEPSLTCGAVDDLDFKDMVYVDGVGWDTSKCCLPGTRESILSEIKDLIYRTGEDAQRIFWMSGTVGNLAPTNVYVYIIGD